MVIRPALLQLFEEGGTSEPEAKRTDDALRTPISSASEPSATIPDKRHVAEARSS